MSDIIEEMERVLEYLVSDWTEWRVNRGIEAFRMFEDITDFMKVPLDSLKIKRPPTEKGDDWRWWAIEVINFFVLGISKDRGEDFYRIYCFDEGLLPAVKKFLRKVFEWDGREI